MNNKKGCYRLLKPNEIINGIIMSFHLIVLKCIICNYEKNLQPCFIWCDMKFIMIII